MAKRYLITVDNELDKVLSKVKGMGDKMATKIVNIVRAWLGEKTFVKDYSLKK